ncbi:MAG: hypothetical protein A3H57_01700 [Candidatus Taylorbacteria bacterium RIFCSPLOWO2_02_FULL_43_11]|uniref:Uncharacterized protein n=1 Tax=Candidatus Taylorbacteria bacterium RIFCSPHIGHO2_02_FULL_43_32b TaxID=1802306 RepID=A0A1G2ME74_9BACT|nr:MAG: hypothetical protein A2743_00060 [Candidatus Taylorbacteria bacterium RIFCSPHIGHO2_01_FULL_43_47]OHA22210.1 MAG: hypothetical protein A3C72_04000 [Candidatus Taylorbacteria bacterium RIFCSPHIGHO2_02_FULL_43_32b]OHA29045.1 MAG: hypothetical protein A3B08_00165 [Candidatus Taylorbacteria bacterium RIFCSPLOWO2_01_FULL_43_44]OHA35703.1 MAG: hypothetical protein A3H57_01700 [Candidatus Taylorbacteria bacterium RIFCSPLOWO2_02_FULL_43_11]
MKISRISFVAFLGAAFAFTLFLSAVILPNHASALTPSAGSTLTGSSQEFGWNAIPGATNYFIYLGSSVGSKDIYSSGDLSSEVRSVTASPIPTNGQKLYLRVWVKINGSWKYYDFTYWASGVGTKMVSPSAGATITSSSKEFVWSPVPGMTKYAVWLGTTRGGKEIFPLGKENGATVDSSTRITILDIPLSGQFLYLRIFWSPDGLNWSQYQDFVFKASGSIPTSINQIEPAPNTTLAQRVTFKWNAVQGATNYAIWLSNYSNSGKDLQFYSNSSLGAVTKAENILVPKNGQPVYARIWYYVNGAWKSQVFVYRTTGVGLSMTPAHGTTISNVLTPFKWSPVQGATAYSVRVSNSANPVGTNSVIYYGGANGISTGANTAISLDDLLYSPSLPTDGSLVYFRVYWYVPYEANYADWQFQDFVYKTAGGSSPSIVSVSPAPNSSLARSTTFKWNAVTGATSYAFWLGYRYGGSTALSEPIIRDLTLKTSTSKEATVPQNGQPMYVRLWYYKNGGWTSQVFNYTAAGSGITSITPPSGSTLVGTFQDFTWSKPAGAAQYAVSLGTTVGGKDVFDSQTQTITSNTIKINDLELKGRKLYLRIYWWDGTANGNWEYQDFWYKEAGAGGVATSIVSVIPSPNTELPSGDITFQWNAVSGATGYAIWLSTIQNGSKADQFYVDTGLGTETKAVVPGIKIPQNGQTLYARIWYYVNGAWKSQVISYKTKGPGTSMLTPPNGSTLTSSTQKFAWAEISGVDLYSVLVGTSVGGYDIYGNDSNGIDTKYAKEVTVSNIPRDGKRVYLRVYWHKAGGTWNNNFQDFWFTANNAGL